MAIATGFLTVLGTGASGPSAGLVPRCPEGHSTGHLEVASAGCLRGSQSGVVGPVARGFAR
jgi:hypothetical protein